MVHAPRTERVTHGVKGSGNQRAAIEPRRNGAIDPTARAAMVAVGTFFVCLVVVLVLPRSVTLPFPRPLDEPRSWPMPLLLMSVPAVLMVHVSRTWREARRAATWTVGQAQVTSSAMIVEHRKRSGGVTQVFNVPAVTYSFSNGRSTFKGDRIGITDPPRNGAAVASILSRFPVGATVPVYYDPNNPGRAVLDRGFPARGGGVLLFCALSVVICAGLSALVLWPDEVSQWLESRFPSGAHPIAAIFFGCAALVVLAGLLANRRQAGRARTWPAVRGRIVGSKVDSFVTRAGGARSGTRMEYYQAVVEYAYVVEQREFHSTQRSLGPEVAGNEAEATEKAGRYLVGQEVDVHVDPADPSSAVLDVATPLAWPTLVLGLVFAGLACFFSGLLA